MSTDKQEMRELAQAFLECADDEVQASALVPDQATFERAIQTARNILASPTPAPAEAATDNWQPDKASAAWVEYVCNCEQELCAYDQEHFLAGFNAAQARIKELEEALGERKFPVHTPTGHDCPAYIKWSALNENVAYKNHGQTLERLAQRGGLCVEEIYAVRHCKEWRQMEGVPFETCLAEVKSIRWPDQAAPADGVREAAERALAAYNEVMRIANIQGEDADETCKKCADPEDCQCDWVDASRACTKAFADLDQALEATAPKSPAPCEHGKDEFNG